METAADVDTNKNTNEKIYLTALQVFLKIDFLLNIHFIAFNHFFLFDISVSSLIVIVKKNNYFFLGKTS